MRQVTVQLVVLVLAAAQCLMVDGQQYVPVPIYIPTFLGNQSVYGGRPSYNNSNPHNNSYRPQNGFNSTQNNGYRPPGSYLGNVFPNYHRYFNGSGYPPSYNGSRDGHLFVGQVQMYDRLLFNQIYRKERRWWSSRDVTIKYPADSTGGYGRHERISAIRIYNQFLDGNSARASILKGGIGYQYVKIYLESGWNKGFQYLVQIYGH